jgi:hypothetical protein
MGATLLQEPGSIGSASCLLVLVQQLLLVLMLSQSIILAHD